MSTKNIVLKSMLLLAGLVSTQTAKPDAETVAAISELKGAINARMDAMEKEMDEVKNFAKAAYGRVREVAEKLSSQEKMQKQALKAMTGTDDIESMMSNISKVSSKERGRTKSRSKSAPARSAEPANYMPAGIRGLPR